ncbi:FecR family protein [Thiohalorhabdus sp. Cl-TMA]|uniref:FecR domain-containing protein n=1 Tax=Thiohalorhabdus methylotrophus TaxID=3242694 RepID=A0ABV4TZG0_9GAMM
MRENRSGIRLVWLGLILMLASSAVWSAESRSVGKVVSRVGDVHAVGGAWEERTLRRGDPVYEEDVIRTGPDGRTRIRFFDNGLVELKPNTRFEVERYRAKAGDGRDKGVLMRLWKGAFRTVTGWVGEEEKDSYRVRTPAATIGIRGTRYAARYCESACGRDFRTGEKVPSGLYLRVEDGQVRLSNLKDAQVFGRDKYSYVASRTAPIETIERPPGPIFSGETPIQGGEDGVRLRQDSSDDRSLWKQGPSSESGPDLLLDESGEVMGVESREEP